LKAGEHVEDGIPLVRVTDIVAGDLGLERLKRCNPEREKLFARARLESGDLVITKDGTIGRCMLVPAWLDGANITQHVLRLSATREAVSAYLLHALHSPLLSSLMKKETRGVALQGINVEDFRLLPIPLPPLAEQHRIVAEVDRRLSVMDQLERTVEANLARCERLRQSILKRAFEGRLVSSDAPMPSAQPV
jgi:type I restriction enzyme S subunit